MTNFQLMNLIFRNLLYSDELKTWMDGVKNGFNSKSGEKTCSCRALWCPCQVGCSEFGSDRCEKICALFPDKCLPSLMPF